MPFESKAQQGYLHAHPEKLGAAKLAEFDAATKGMHHLPEHVKDGKPSYKQVRATRKEVNK
jgi:hypothetical protein